MITLFEKKEDCCGCTACKSICPTKAIEMTPDEEGFLYPEVVQELCIECGLCHEVCAFKNTPKIIDKLSEPEIFAVKHKNEQERMNSTSGAAYIAISDYALQKKYAIYGVEFDNNFSVKHVRVINKKERDKLRGSKYVQSFLGDIFIQVKEDLKSKRPVLFTGTGCQVAGLINYLRIAGIKTNNIVTNDIVCHGTPSPLLWNNYLDFIQKKRKLKDYSFRYKAEGWRGYNIMAEFENGKKKVNTSNIRVFAELFSSDLALRPSCYQCLYTNLQRPSDIMIGDFWGIEKTLPEVDDNKGISLVLVNTLKGKKLFEDIKNDIEFWQTNKRDCLQPNLQYPTRKPERRYEFWQDYHEYGFEYIAKKYAGYSLKGRAKKLLIYVLKKTGTLEPIRRLIRRN